MRERIDAAAARAGRDQAGIELVAVVKGAPTDSVRALLESGQVRFVAESRVQDAQRRRIELGAAAERARWRFIGHLQTNKIRPCLGLFEWLDSLDSLKLAEALNAQLEREGRDLPILVRVKLAERETQSGVAPESLAEFLTALKACPRLKARGLMTIAPMLEPVEAVRPVFRRMRALLAEHFGPREGPEPPLLSMGMSRDFEIAVEEGADLVRVGSALFEPPAAAP
ncbi:MAG TPA: YggS family pyridoxal phosphate-dependent enzyme [Elusimicrobiota bacterium]|nr:YggS family pyridoxal phosphate-dependent enzyme [Elusimicrobiota bacterium]